MGVLPNEPIPHPHVSPNLEVASRRPQIEHIMWVVERPDHHCGDDLVKYLNFILLFYHLISAAMIVYILAFATIDIINFKIHDVCDCDRHTLVAHDLLL